jgi:hypothetical protein
MPEDRHDDERREPPAWDRVGQFLEEMAAVGEGIAKRNRQLWTEISTNLRAEQYPADAMSTDAARAMTAAMDNLEDVWMFLTRPPDRQRVATTLPTVFLRFWPEDEHWSQPDPVWIRVPYWGRDDLPARASVHLEGDEALVTPLVRALRVELQGSNYLLEVAGAEGLEPGVYTGIVAVGDRPLANLRIVVERERR